MRAQEVAVSYRQRQLVVDAVGEPPGGLQTGRHFVPLGWGPAPRRLGLLPLRHVDDEHADANDRAVWRPHGKEIGHPALTRIAWPQHTSVFDVGHRATGFDDLTASR